MMNVSSAASFLRDSLVNFVTGLGTAKDPRTSTHYHYSWIDRNVLEKMYRTDWLARKIVDAPAEDATREWRTWLTDKAQAAKIEKLEKALQIQRKTREALIRARLYGGAALVLGVDQGLPDEELDLSKITRDSLQFVVVLNRYELNAGPRIYNVDSPYYTRPEYYTVATPMFGFLGEDGGASPANNNSVRGTVPVYPYGQSPPNVSYIGGRDRDRGGAYSTPGLIGIYPSRVIEFSGNELPDWRLAPMGGGWGDPVLQTVEDALKDFGMIISGLASMINDMKMDVVKVPDLSRKLSTAELSSKLLNRFTVANQAKSTINTLLLDKEEDWERITTQFGSTPALIETAMQVACAAGGIPVSRAMGSAPNKGLSHAGGSGGEVDIKNYYDVIGADQQTKYRPRMMPLDVCLACSALGPDGVDVDYMWNPLYRPTAAEEATVAFQKAQATQIYVGTGLISEDVLRDGVVNQLIEDDVYPGLQESIDANGGAAPDVEEPPPEEPPPTPPPGFLPKGQFEPNPFKMLAAQKQAKAVTDFLSFMDDYDENEPRDELGKWTSAGGGAIQAGTKKAAAVKHLLGMGSAGATAEGLAQHIYGKSHAEAGGALSGVIKGISIAAPKAGYKFEKKYGSGASAVYALTKNATPAATTPLEHFQAQQEAAKAEPALPPGHAFQHSTSGYWHVINKNMDSVGYGTTKAEAVVSAQKDPQWPVKMIGATASPAVIPSPFSAKASLPVKVDDWKKIGPQAGSNPGGLYQAPTGDQYYIKTPPLEDYARNEVLTGKLYALAGAKVPSTGLVSMGGKVAVASKMIPGGASASVDTYGNLEKKYPDVTNDIYKKDAQADFAADAWLGNRDSVGLTKDNLLVGGDGHVYRVDHGGGMNYRAQGQTKEFGPNADEFHSLRDPGINVQAASVFGKMTDEELKASIAKVTSVSPAAISEAVASVYPKGTTKYDQLTKTLSDRQWYLFQEAQKLGGAAPPEPVPAKFAHEAPPSQEDIEAEQGAPPPITQENFEKLAAVAKQAAQEHAAKATPKWSETNLPPGWVAKKSTGNPLAISLYANSAYQGKVVPVDENGVSVTTLTPDAKWRVLGIVGDLPSKDDAIHALVSSKYDPAAAAKQAEATAKAQAAAKMTAAQKQAAYAAKQAEVAKIAAMADYTPEESVKSVISGAATTQGGFDNYVKKAGEIAAKHYGPDVKPIEAAAIAAYTDGTYGTINEALRQNSMSEKQLLYAAVLKSGLKKMPKFIGTTTRGAALSDGDRAKYKVGSVMMEPGFQSTSPTKPWTGRNTGFVYETHNGAHVGHLAMMHNHESEDEVIIPSHIFMKVVDYYKNGSGPVPAWVTKPGVYEHNYHMVEIKSAEGFT